MALLLASAQDSFFFQVALALFILGVCVFCLKQVASVLERRNRLLDLEECVRCKNSE